MDEFWAIIDSSLAQSGGNPDVQLDVLTRRLGSMTKADLLRYFKSYEAAHETAYTWPLWDAASVINGGASDDGFAYFRDWLIGQGRKTFEMAVRSPGSLAWKAPPFEAEHEALRYVGLDAYLELTGEEPPINLDSMREPSGTRSNGIGTVLKFPRLVAWVLWKVVVTR